MYSGGDLGDAGEVRGAGEGLKVEEKERGGGNGGEVYRSHLLWFVCLVDIGEERKERRWSGDVC